MRKVDLKCYLEVPTETRQVRAIARHQRDVVVVVERRVGTTLAARVSARRATPPRTHRARRARRLCAPHALQPLDLRTPRLL